ncbi:hypothetical protein [Oceanobacillus kimchii]|nr:hypothetical protein [Oceanobacillus kimchii]
MKIKIFTGLSEQVLSKKVNRFLEVNSIEVVDIKLSSSIFYMGVMVIYN